MIEFLESIGLNKTESRVYLALVDRGELKTGEILAVTKLNSGRIYEVLNNLQSKGFISSNTKNGIKYFSAAPPTILQDYLATKESALVKQKQEVNNVLPDLMKRYMNRIEGSKVEVFTGKQGMRSSYEILFEESKKDKNLYVTGISGQIDYAGWMPTFIKTYVYPSRTRLKLKIKKLMNIGAKSEKLWKTDNSEIRFIPLNALTSYEILGDVVIIQILNGETIHLVIRDKQVANDFRQQFMLLWENAKK